MYGLWLSNLLKWMGNVLIVALGIKWRKIVEKAANPKHGVKTKELAGKVQKLNSIKHETTPRVLTDSAEFNRVLGGGIVSGSLVLIGGDPGIGKSTLLLQICASLLSKEKSTIYYGEESLSQTKLRAERLDEDSSELQSIS